MVERNRWRVEHTKHGFCSNRCSHAATPTWTTDKQYRAGFKADLGHYVRSSWEANVCRFFRHLRVPYEYEPKTFSLGSTTYRPDLWVGYWVEVKGWMRQDAEDKIAAFQRTYPDEVLIVIDAPMYRAIEAEFADRIPEWELDREPPRGRTLDRRRKEVRAALGLPPAGGGRAKAA